MNKLVGNDNGCFDIAPYETKKAFDPRRRVMYVVEGPETQFKAKCMGYWAYKYSCGRIRN